MSRFGTASCRAGGALSSPSLVLLCTNTGRRLFLLADEIINRKLRSCVACRLDDHRNSTSRKEERGARHIPRKQRYVSRIISPRSERVCPWLGWARARQPREWRGATLKSEGVAKGPKLFSKRVGRSYLATAPPICRQHKAQTGKHPERGQVAAIPVAVVDTSSKPVSTPRPC